MKFIKEKGIIIDNYKKVISSFLGTPGSVDFPADIIVELHKKAPGCIGRFVHTHPPGIVQLSDTDMNEFMKPWARALHPWPVRLSTVTVTGEFDAGAWGLNRIHVFSESIYVAILQPKSLWKESGEERELSIEMESRHQYHFNSEENRLPTYIKQVIHQSYEE